MLIDFHGTYKPTGLSRTYPNVINYEGIYGLENLKWNNNADQVTYDVTLPFIRFFAGSADYTQGAMRNASKANFRAVWDEGMRRWLLTEKSPNMSPLQEGAETNGTSGYSETGTDATLS